MLGRGVGETMRRRGTGRGHVAPEVVEAARGADLVVLNLECRVSERGERWPAPGKPFFVRAPPAGVEFLAELGGFIDDYAVDPVLRNDLGLLGTVTVGPEGPTRIECLPLSVGDRRTRAAAGRDLAWIESRPRSACAELGSEVRREQGLLVVG